MIGFSPLSCRNSSHALPPHVEIIQSEMAKFLSEITLAIIDEGPMLDRLCYEAIERTMRDVVPDEHQSKKFGGKIMLISSDFR